MFILRGGGREITCQLLYSQTVVPMNGSSEEQIISPVCVPGALQITVDMLYASRVFTCLLSKSTAVLSQLMPLSFNTPIFKSVWWKEFMKFSPSPHFPNQYLWGNILFAPSPVCFSFFCPSPQRWRPPFLHPEQQGSIAPINPISAVTTFSDVTFSLLSVVEFVLSDFRSIYEVFRML